MTQQDDRAFEFKKKWFGKFLTDGRMLVEVVGFSAYSSVSNSGVLICEDCKRPHDDTITIPSMYVGGKWMMLDPDEIQEAA